MKKLSRHAVIAVVAALAYGIMFSPVVAQENQTLVDVAIELNTDTNSPYYGEFDILIGAVLAADPAIVATLSAPGQRTVFAPIDAAFEDIGITEENVDETDEETLTEVLAYHVVNGRRNSTSVLNAKGFRTLQGGVVYQDGGVLTDAVGRPANIIVTDVPADNGIIHAIDSVLLPNEAPTVVDLAIELNSNTNSPYFGEFDILIAAVLAADPAVVEALTGAGQRTVFAPIDAAFEDIGITEETVDEVDQETLTEVLVYHVAKGRRSSTSVLNSKGFRTLGGIVYQDGGVLTDELGRKSNIIVTDLRAKNGIIHAIDSVLLPYAAPTVVDLAIELNSNENSPYFGEFDILIAALLAADPVVLEVLSSGGQRTVFAPVDAAFEDIGITEENVGDLDQEFLTEVLAYHVTKGRRNSKSVLKAKGFRTLQGEVLLQGSGVLTDALDREADIIAVDLRAKNGIIHGINAVVLPFAPPE